MLLLEVLARCAGQARGNQQARHGLTRLLDRVNVGILIRAAKQGDRSGQHVLCNESNRRGCCAGQTRARCKAGIERVRRDAGRQAQRQGVGEVDVGQLRCGVQTLPAGNGLVPGSRGAQFAA